MHWEFDGEHYEIDWALLWEFGNAENKPHNKAWLVTWGSGEYVERTNTGKDNVYRINAGQRKMTLRQVANISYRLCPFVTDVVHLPTGASFRM